MKNKKLLLTFLVGAVLCGCKGTANASGDKDSKADLNKDFPSTEKLTFTLFNTYEINENIDRCRPRIDGNTLWIFEEGGGTFGSCYDLKTGNILSSINRQRESEKAIKNINGIYLASNSVIVLEGTNIIHAFNKNDIANNVAQEKRRYERIAIPNDILVGSLTQLPNGAILAATRPPFFEFGEKERDEVKDKNLLLFQNDAVQSFATIDYKSFNLTKATEEQLPANDLIKWSYAQGCIKAKDDNTTVLSAHGQFILYTLDLNSGKVMHEKRYTTPTRIGEGMTLSTSNANQLQIEDIKVNDKHILCKVCGYFNEEDKNAQKLSRALFVFDWNLNPLKKFDLPTREEGNYVIPEDCSAVYFYKFDRKGLTLYRADLNL